MMDPNIVVAIISGTSSLIVAIMSVYLNNRVITYKIDDLQKKIDRLEPNNEKVVKLEAGMDSVWKRYDDMSLRIDRIEGSEK